MSTSSKPRIRLPKAARTEQILSAAIELIGAHGYDSFSLKQLAARCEMTDAGLLHHFGSKEGLLIALLTERDRQDEEAISQSLGGGASADPKTLAQALQVLRSIVTRNASRPELARLYTVLRVEALRPGHPARDFFDRRDAATLQLMSRLLGTVSREPVRAGRAVVAMMNGLALQWLAEGETFDLVAEWDRVAPGLVA